jgi:hypothetical protein
VNGALSAPPLRDLPPGRLALRAAHLRAELGAPARPARRPRLATVVALALALAALLLAAQALGLGRHLFGKDHRPPPEVIRRMFTTMIHTKPGTVPPVLADKARIAVELRVPGYGTQSLWVAPTRSGGFCTTGPGGCDLNRRKTMRTTLEIAGPTRTAAPVGRHVHVFILGDTLVHGAARLAVRFEDGSFEQAPLVWVSKPIDAGFFLYELPKAHWRPGKRPAALFVEDAHGRKLASSTTAAGYFRQSQLQGLAPPPRSGTSLVWLLPLVAVLIAAALLFWRLASTRRSAGGRP